MGVHVLGLDISLGYMTRNLNPAVGEIRLSPVLA
jgi:hypothetical protein